MLGDLGKLIVAKGFKNLPKVQKIARSGHTGPTVHCGIRRPLCLVWMNRRLPWPDPQQFLKSIVHNNNLIIFNGRNEAIFIQDNSILSHNIDKANVRSAFDAITLTHIILFIRSLSFEIQFFKWQKCSQLMRRTLIDRIFSWPNGSRSILTKNVKF